jgi:glycosyltransferase involved in cell wall biosynthesis
MRERFFAVYPNPTLRQKALVFGNAFLFFEDAALEPLPRRPTLGHLSVLTIEKGIDYVFDMFDVIRQTRQDVRLVVAGPTRQKVVADLLEEAARKYGDDFEYRGAVHGQDKDRFFSDMNLFVFPSRLIDEADPLVILESLSRGRDVMATNRGCIGENLRDPSQILSMNLPLDASRAIEMLAEIERDPDRSAARCVAHGRSLRSAAAQQAQALLAAMGADGQEPGGQ